MTTSAPNVQSYRFMTFNLCNIPQMDRDPVWGGLRFQDRLDKIAGVFERFLPDAIGLQEVRDYQGGSVMADLWRILSPLGYRIKFQEGSPDKLCTCNAIAYKAATLFPQTVTAWWNSATPEEPSCSYGNGWPRSVLGIEFYPIKQTTVFRKKQGSGEEVSFDRPTPDYSSLPIFMVNSHLGLGIATSDPKEKVISNAITVEKITQLVKSRSMFVVSLGDFNSFPQSKFYEEEMEVYRSKGFIDGITSSPLKNQDGLPISGTFMGYSPDPFKCTDGKFGDSLDHIWYRTFNQSEQWEINIRSCFVSTITGDKELDCRKITQEKELLVAADGAPLRDRYPSDHLQGILDVEVRNRPVSL